MEFRVVRSDYMFELESNVNDALSHGWRLQGGVSVIAYQSGKPAYFQALVREI
ncbi:DUF1737 domain-containing protein [Leuconostoc gelidum subsp. gasicomitatum]|uniref:DUF1737 domain-containing protein n=1 Tax=Leuconostoc gasicomitatum TaxID=115778 RepID=UPI001CC613A8|nr:DUF1737 domain-containing protein [Leuconostoc gasicomitatum]MBZ5995366.1 DUF1737 domain-containing protein [Leuconostoc gasicomitatum]